MNELGFEKMMNATYEVYDNEYEQLINDNADKDELIADRMASSHLRPQYKKNLIQRYKFMKKVMHMLEDSSVDRDIEKSIRTYQNRGYDHEIAVDKAVQGKKFLFDRLLDLGDEHCSDATDSE